MLGPEWLFSADDNPAYASPAYDDSGWRTVSTDRTLLSYGIRDIRYAWYRIHVHVRPRTRYLAIETQYITGSYEIYVNGVRIGANGRMNGLIESGQSYLTFYDIPDSMTAPDGDLVIAIRFALNRAGTQFGTNTPFITGGVMLALNDAAQRDASYEAAHQATIPFILCGLSFVVGIVALVLYLAMRMQVEYLAIAVSLLAAGLQMLFIAWSHLHTGTAGSDLLGALWLGITNVALIEFVRLILHLRLRRWLLALEIANFLGYFAGSLSNMGFLSSLPTMAAYFLPALAVKAVLCVLLLRGLLRGNRDARVVLPAIAIISIANYWYFLFLVSIFGQWSMHIPTPGILRRILPVKSCRSRMDCLSASPPQQATLNPHSTSPQANRSHSSPMESWRPATKQARSSALSVPPAFRSKAPIKSSKLRSSSDRKTTSPRSR